MSGPTGAPAREGRSRGSLWRSRRMSGVAVAVAVTIGTVVTLVLSNHASPSAPPSSQQLTDLRDVTQLRSMFNAGAGEARLILILSPT